MFSCTVSSFEKYFFCSISEPDFYQEVFEKGKATNLQPFVIIVQIIIIFHMKQTFKEHFWSVLMLSLSSGTGRLSLFFTFN